jgi:3-hydroxyisobutyrate dehydrogenase-like beta-hydroxyacid dehydrogenase
VRCTFSTSTVSPGISRRVAEEHARHHQDYVAAPVLGNPDFARERKLFVLAGGPRSSLQKVRLGQHLFVIGEDAGLANLMKLAANTLTATTLECMGEVLELLRKGGIDRHLAYDVLTNSLFDSRVQKAYGGEIVDERYTPTSRWRRASGTTSAGRRSVCSRRSTRALAMAAEEARWTT